jgi:hypothetical protein
VGIQGKMGSGKTLSQTILGVYLNKITGAPLYANYHLAGVEYEYINSFSAFKQVEDGIILWDELWLTMDARLWTNNVALTRWINQTRKKKIILFYTTQHIRQVELRVRNATDILIHCDKRPEGVWLQFMDFQYEQLGMRYLLNDPARFYNLYNTYEVLEPLKYKKEYDD